ncbi:hypothetical protein [Rhizobium sp. Root1220]|uniref:hypothetical protein n=1 Tax=Rhizobium sp. Root1220 TaxID=1736432 RepID=UPI0006F81E93|nr:hypothetical protein [Rhizobium sp. Root1220]KQV78163.1 hypothetical protein ASC90_26935 [Rhizobium sp. Root1220]
MFGLGIFDAAKIGAGVALGGALAVYPAILVGRSEGRAAVQAEAAKEALVRIDNLEKNNANFHKLSDRDRCLVFMRDSGLPDENCQ